MGCAKPVLGYPSHTDAVRALRASGSTKGAIAERLGITPGDVTSIENKALARGDQSEPQRGPVGAIYMRDVSLPIDLMLRLRRSAAERDMTVENLIRALLTMIVDDQLISAVLDVEKCKT